MGRPLLPFAAVALAVLAVVLLGTALRTDGPMPTPSVLPMAMDPEATQTPRVVVVERVVTPTATPPPFATADVANCFATGYEGQEVCRWPTPNPVVPTQVFPLPTCGTPDPSQVCIWRTPRPTPAYAYPMGG